MKKERKPNLAHECRKAVVGVPYKRPKDFWSSLDRACDKFFESRGMGKMSEHTDWARPNRGEEKNG